MSVTLNPYLNWRDQARSALEFYHSVLGGELTMSTFGDFGVSDDPGEKDKIMHGQLEAENGMTLMGADVPASMEHDRGRAAASVSLSGDDEPTLRRYWEGLSEGATIREPLVQAPWGDHFGMLTDKFGIDWMVNIAGSPAGGGDAGEADGAAV